MKLKELAARHPWIRRAAVAVIVMYCLNAAAVSIGSSILGGRANAGKVEAGHYYVGHRGIYTEVSRGAFIYSQIHTESILYLLPLAGLGWWIWSTTTEDVKPEVKPNPVLGCFFLVTMVLFAVLWYLGPSKFR